MTVTERFLKYVSIDTPADPYSGTHPSSSCQFNLGNFLADELKSLGLQDVSIDDKCYVYGFLPATSGLEDADNIGFIAHMDTAPASPGIGVKASVQMQDGIEVVATDKTTLLGADDKAGVAEIVTMLEYFFEHPDEPHRGIAVAFTPDEEIGEGADNFDLSKLNAKVAYTVDGGPLDELNYETFNAAGGVVTVNGYNVHPVEAKGKMRNAVLMAANFIQAFPFEESPATTEGYEGYYHVGDVRANESKAEIEFIVRDFFTDSFNARKKFVSDLVDKMNEKYGAGTFVLDMKDSYYNMREKLESHMYLIEKATEALRQVGYDAKSVPIRGGTDGSRLSFMGLPCPNLPAGGQEMHSVNEFVPVKALIDMVEVLKILSR